MGFTLEVFETVRRVWPSGKLIGIRISAVDWDEPGWTLDESVVFSGELKQLGCDFIDCSSGGNSPKRPPGGPSPSGLPGSLCRVHSKEHRHPNHGRGDA